MNTTNTTTDTIEIEKWITARDGKPSIVKNTEDLLRIKFDSMQDDLEEITRARFFQILAEKKLQFVYDASDESRFYKITN